MIEVDVYVRTFEAVRSATPGSLSTLTLPEPPPLLMQRRFNNGNPREFPVDRDLPFTLGLVLGEWDAGAAARIYDDTGWRVVPAVQGENELDEDEPTWVSLDAPGDFLTAALPVGHLVATARVTDVEQTRDEAGVLRLWRWHLSGVAVVDDPPRADVPDGRTVWVS